MANLKRLAVTDDELLSVKNPITDSEIQQRHMDYPLLTEKRFAKKYNELLFEPIEFTYKGQEFSIQFNHCTNPFCKWYGLTQKRFENIKGKPSRYRLSGSSKHGSQTLMCNPDPIHPHQGATLSSSSVPLSNWSVVEEIKRLITNDSVKDEEPDYQFHKHGCAVDYATPFENRSLFYKQGKSSGKSQRWQCKTCKKITNVLPNRKQTFTFNQKRNDILPNFAKCLINRTPVTRTCEILNISPKTYYHKLEWLYRRCLEFLERHETQAFENQQFDSIWLNTDQMIYYLNNVRKKGQSDGRYVNIEDTKYPTYVVISGDINSNYIFRSDVSYDWHISLNDIEQDTKLYKDDHLNKFARKHARLRFSYAPQHPTKNDAQSKRDYHFEKDQFDRRRNYVDGMHVNPTYTTMAHLWLIRQMVHTKKWRIVSDDDSATLTSLRRVFSHEIRLGDAHHFLCKIDRNKSLHDTYQEHQEAKSDLIGWGQSHGLYRTSLRYLAFKWLEEELKTHRFHKEVLDGTSYHNEWANNPIEHPLPPIDKGFYEVDCTTDLSAYEPDYIANMILKVSDKPTSAFMQQIRRRLSILERPLMTARGDGKSYIYANFNPRYAQYAITILRTYYNFCFQIKFRDGKKTPAQRLGLTDKQFDMNDIIYFK